MGKQKKREYASITPKNTHLLILTDFFLYLAYIFPNCQLIALAKNWIISVIRYLFHPFYLSLHQKYQKMSREHFFWKRYIPVGHCIQVQCTFRIGLNTNFPFPRWFQVINTVTWGRGDLYFPSLNETALTITINSDRNILTRKYTIYTR